jgi:carbonic anhydrase
MGKFDRFAFSAASDYDEAETRRAFSQAVPLKTIVIHCYDPRAAEIPAKVAEALGDEVFPGEILHDAAGNRIASTATIFPVVVAGGRAVDALRSITVAQHLFGIENVVVVHHSQCGGTTFTADGIVAAYRHEHGADIAPLYDKDSISITDFEVSLRYDCALIRANPGTPCHANVRGYFYDIDAGTLTEVVRDPAQKRAVDAGSIGEGSLSLDRLV